MTPDPALDLFPLAAALLAALCCGLLGNLLVLRRQSLMGDAISHGVLPGLVAGFLISGSRAAGPMLLGATLAGIATVALVSAIRRLGRIESGAAMGVVFTVLFALGVLLIEQAAARQVDLDADCVLHGQLETLVWYGAPASWSEVASWSTLEAVPRQVWMLLVVTLVDVGFMTILFKELRLAAFDPALASALGFRASTLNVVTMVLVAVATVASFEAVGSILVVAMLVCPAATSRFLTDRMSRQLWWSAFVAIATAVLGYWAATAIPATAGWDSVNAAGSMTVVAGCLLATAALAAPRNGVLARWWARRRLAAAIALEDLLVGLWRQEEGHRTEEIGPRSRPDAVTAAMRRGLVTRDAAGRLILVEDGRQEALGLIRRHRLWEHYLVEEAGIAEDHVHETAEQLEHVRVEPSVNADSDPHGRAIPDPADSPPQNPGSDDTGSGDRAS